MWNLRPLRPMQRVTARVAEKAHVFMCSRHKILCHGVIMTYEQFLAELGKAGLSVRAFADLVGMNRNSVSNYASAGEVPRHLAVIAVLLAEMRLREVPFERAIDRVGVARKRPRGNAAPGRFGGTRQEQLALMHDPSDVQP